MNRSARRAGTDGDAAARSVLLRCKAWDDFRQLVDPLPPKLKGDCFELVTQEYLRLDARYSNLKQVWRTHGGVPRQVLTRLNLFGHDVTGIDLIAETEHGKFWAVQCKYHQDEHRSLTREEATGLIAGRNRAHGEFELGLVATTANGRSANLAGEPDLEFLMGDVWRGLDAEFFARLHADLRGSLPKPPPAKTPRPHQREALSGIAKHFSSERRGKVVMPCATGKSLIGFWFAGRLEARRVLVTVPNLSLVRQLLKDWTEQSLARGRRPHWAVVCSDDSVADSVAARDMGVKVDTDLKEVTAWLRLNRRSKECVVFATYQSGRLLAKAARRAGMAFDLGIFDEAHRTAGRQGSAFAHLLHDDNIRLRKRVFMTATPRVYGGPEREDVISMDDPSLYGGEAFRMTFLEAMNRGIVPNLTIVAVTVSRAEISRLLRDRLLVRLQREQEDEIIRSEDLVSALALRKAMKKYGIRRTLGFYSSRKRCRTAAAVQSLVSRIFPQYGALETFHVDGEMTAAERDAEMRAFEKSQSALLTNVRVFVEGVDCPSMDCVMFADPRQSVIDIVQGVGRALRPFKGKTAGYALIPTIIEDDGTPSDAAYGEIVRVTSALGSENEVILDYFAAIAQGKPWTGRRVFEFLGDISVGVKVDLDEVNRAVAVRTYERTVEFRPFEEARAFARRLGLKNAEEWRSYCRGRTPGSPRKPPDIPANPHSQYAESGWVSYGDWLGTGAVSLWLRSFRPFAQARAFVRRLGLKNQQEWMEYSKGRLPGHARKPDDIPATPGNVYKGHGWISLGDWIGTGVVAPRFRKYRGFKEARDFVRRLGLRSWSQWRLYCHGRLPGFGAKPDDVPLNANRTYRNDGWISHGDWLGSGRISNNLREYRPFTQARAFVRRLGLKNADEWHRYSKGRLSGRDPRPDDIPATPERVYRTSGWLSLGDWLGTGVVAASLRTYRPFVQARAFAHRLRLENQKEWLDYCRGRLTGYQQKPDDVPSHPQRTYSSEGWTSWGDWLGTGVVACSRRTYRPFRKARAFVRRLGLANSDEWHLYCKGKLPGRAAKPDDIPVAARRVYQGDGWVSMGDWLGTGTVASSLQRYRPFTQARAFVRRLGLKNGDEWHLYYKGCLPGHAFKPTDIPAAPRAVYKKDGWISMGDWLGTGTVASVYLRYRPFVRARAFVRGLGLRNQREWVAYCRGELPGHKPKPDDIPSHADRTYRDSGWISLGDWLGTG